MLRNHYRGVTEFRIVDYSIYAMLSEIQQFSSNCQVQVLNLISVSMEHAGEKITPFAKHLAEFFQKVCFFCIYDYLVCKRSIMLLPVQ